MNYQIKACFYNIMFGELIWTLDVLMVMHAHMLNPRAFLEDAIRTNMIEYWTAGMPWLPVNNAISTDFSYNANDEAKTNWVARTGLNWDNQADSMTKDFRCPWCKGGLKVPWTTCGTASESERYCCHNSIMQIRYI